MGLFIKKNNQLVPVGTCTESKLRTNIHFSSTTAPTDTNKLWVKTDTVPTKTVIKDKAYSEASDNVTALSVVNPDKAYIDNFSYCIYDNKVYFTTGYLISSGNYGLKLRCLDLSTNIISDVGTAYSGSTNFLYSGGVFIVDGELWIVSINWDSAGSGTPNAAVKYNFSTQTFTSLGNLGNNKYSYAILVGRKIFFSFYKSDDGYTYYIGNLQVYDIDQGTIVHTSSYSISYSRYGENLKRDAGFISLGNYIYFFYTNKSSTNNHYIKWDINNYARTTSDALWDDSLNKIMQRVCVVNNDIYCIISDSTSPANYKLNKMVLNNDSPTFTEIVDITSLGTSGNPVIYSFFYYMNKIYMSSSNGNFFTDSVTVPLLENNMLLLTNTQKEGMNLINSDIYTLEINPYRVYLGDSNDEGQQVDAALYDANTQTWVNI